MDDQNVVLLSKGVLANICASKRADEILAVQPYHCAIIDTMLTSLPVLWDTSQEEEVMIDCHDIVAALIKKEHLQVYPVQREQYLHTHVLLGRYLREEYADIFTIADVQGAVVALDDPVIKQRVKMLFPHISIRSTLDMLHHWFTLASPLSKELQDVLRDISHYAYFRPSQDDALFAWWKQFERKLP